MDTAQELVQKIAELELQLRIEKLKNRNSLAHNLCPDHRDKQAGKSCLACEIERLQRECRRAAGTGIPMDGPVPMEPGCYLVNWGGYDGADEALYIDPDGWVWIVSAAVPTDLNTAPYNHPQTRYSHRLTTREKT